MTDPFHICFVVPSLEPAMADFSEAADISWNDVRTGALGEWDYRVVFSTGNPQIELLEGSPGSPWDATGGPRFDHLGWWAASFQDTAERLVGSGFPVDFDGRRFGRQFAYHRADRLGMRLEIHDAANQDAFLETWRPDGPRADVLGEKR